MSALHDIQKKLKVGKNNNNSFGGYNYRTCADILEAVKTLLPDGFFVTLSDEIVLIGDRYYIKATARLMSGNGEIYESTAFARESFSKKGMDDSQITGSASSYARKYALNGLFAIDDTKDADGMDNTLHETKDDAAEKAKAEYKAIVDKHLDSLVCVRDALSAEDYSTAKEAWAELSEEVKTIIWKAPSKGGWFTTKEREQMKSNEWSAAL
ncbi:MAG TPA: ERF family protein [Pseudomonadales bacterium]|nr:ERF family protein [Pseudomonadales bacterium]